jgi:hypothetical protein
MGFFEVLCSESELVLGGATAFILLGENNPDDWTPIAVPLFDTYDRLGRIDMPGDFAEDEIGENAQLILAFLQQCKAATGGSPEEKTLGELVDEHLKEGFLTWEGKRISYALVDQRVYHAIAKTVETTTNPEWKAVCKDSLDNLDAVCLFDKTFDLARVSKAIYKEPSKYKSWLLDPLKELYRYKTWHTQFQPFDLYADGPGQCNGYDSKYGTKKYCEKAREKYRKYPLILEAIEENAEYWKELDTQPV